MSTLQVANVWFESTANNRIQYNGSNTLVIFAGGANTLTINSTAVVHNSNTTTFGSALSIDSSGNLNFLGTGQRITGDMSNATISNRFAFQTSTVNGSTTILALPNGSGTTSQVLLRSKSTALNDNFGQMVIIDSSEFRISSGAAGTAAYVPITFYTGGTEVIRIDTSGNLGIGTSSPASYGKLAIVSPSQYAPAAVFISDSSAANWARTDWKNVNVAYPGIIYQDQGGLFNIRNDGANAIAFSTNGGNERMRIDSSGNVGIGTTSPGYKLEISTSALIGSRLYPVSGTNGATNVVSNNGGNFYYGLDSSTGANFGATYAGVLSHSGAYPILFATSSTERMRIDANGNFLVGTTTVNYAGGGFTLSKDSGTTKWLVGPLAGTPTNFYVTAANSLGVYLAGTSATSWSSASDERLKNIIEPIANGLQKVNTLRAVIGSYKADETKTRRPFLIAQDLQQVLPEAVNASNPDALGVQYTEVIPLLVAAIQELSAKNDALEARLAALENK